ncbi:MAG TPA: hypothetical protein P5307_13455 [Pirellulaceae bacterium]|nr:hypothetical protein [Planctomycetaceae bacterium]HRX80070.1 hypothetical protein [Pirellulaceae bacterium]
MNQSFDPEFIDRIVQEVIRRLVSRGLVLDGAASVDETELAVSDKVVTLATLDGKLLGVKRLVVGGRSIVTPAVKDELKDRSIELVRR